ncbi:MAG: 3-deoxy-7-phosphoheptulonate synthase [Planctomycetes bacterium]|nr:3-deoxy-7-phosphoheptulonate synthase [Planctomycetota bacterium]
MLVVMHAKATSSEVERVCEAIRAMGLAPHPMPGASRTAIGITGNRGTVESASLEALEGVIQVIPVTRPYKLVSREVKADDTLIQLPGGSSIGGEALCVMAGPCAVEGRQQALRIGRAVKAAGATVYRGGAFKPRTSPYAFQGLGREGLEILAEVRAETGLPIITEALDPAGLDLVESVADVIQIGARNMQNFSLLRRAGQARKPVMLKRGMSATLEELLMAAEYILGEGNYQVILCERGVRTFADHARNTLDLSLVPAVQRLSHLPIVVDPSHGTGRRNKVIPLARAAVAVGAHGVMVEVHDDPDRALCDGPQALPPEMFQDLMDQVRALAPIVGRRA